MKNRKTIFTIIFALVLALSIATVSAAAISVNEASRQRSPMFPSVRLPVTAAYSHLRVLLKACVH